MADLRGGWYRTDSMRAPPGRQCGSYRCFVPANPANERRLRWGRLVAECAAPGVSVWSVGAAPAWIAAGAEATGTEALPVAMGMTPTGLPKMRLPATGSPCEAWGIGSVMPAANAGGTHAATTVEAVALSSF